MGDEHYPIPWQQLTYDTDLEGYRTDLTKEKLEGRQNTQAAVTGTGKTGSKAAKYTITMDRRG